LAELFKFLDLPRGLGKVLFGTDFPIQSYEEILGLKIGFKEQENYNGLSKAKGTGLKGGNGFYPRVVR